MVPGIAVCAVWEFPQERPARSRHADRRTKALQCALRACVRTLKALPCRSVSADHSGGVNWSNL